MDETLTAEPVLKSTGILGKGADVTVVKTKKGEAKKTSRSAGEGGDESDQLPH